MSAIRASRGRRMNRLRVVSTTQPETSASAYYRNSLAVEESVRPFEPLFPIPCGELQGWLSISRKREATCRARVTLPMFLRAEALSRAYSKIHDNPCNEICLPEQMMRPERYSVESEVSQSPIV
jgi:hypothetical protein